MKYNLKRMLRRLAFQYAYNSVWCFPSLRSLIYKMGGCDIGSNVYIGREVLLDELYPQGIHIGENSFITQGTKIITHFKYPDREGFYYNDVYIGKNTFVGMNVLITKPISIGNNCLIGAGSIITKDIPDNSEACGNPARVIRKRC